MGEQQNPFRVGQHVVFVPDQRATGWYQHAFDRWGVYPGYDGVVTRAAGDQVELDGKADAAMHWSQFRDAAEVPAAERERLADDYKKRVK